MSLTKEDEMEILDIRLGQGCRRCKYVDKCPDAFTEISHYCGIYGTEE